MGQPMIQSEKAGLKRRLPIKCLLPGRKLTWSGSEERKAGIAPALSPKPLAVIHNSVQVRALSIKAICLPLISVVTCMRKPLSSRRKSTRLPLMPTVGVGQNEEPSPLVGRAAFCRREQACPDAVTHAL